MTDTRFSLLKFYADWCGPCKKMAPTITKLETEFPDIKFISVDIDDSTDLVKKHGVKSVPTLILLDGEKEISRVVGQSLIDPLRKLFRDTLGNNKNKG